MKKQFALVLVITSLALCIARADPQLPAARLPEPPDLSTVHGLFKACTDVYNGYYMPYCDGFILGVGNEMHWLTALLDKKGVRLKTNYCPPASTAPEELREAFIIWHDQHLEHWERYGPAVAGVMAALQEKWPCPSSQTDSRPK